MYTRFSVVIRFLNIDTGNPRIERPSHTRYGSQGRPGRPERQQQAWGIGWHEASIMPLVPCLFHCLSLVFVLHHLTLCNKCSIPTVHLGKQHADDCSECVLTLLGGTTHLLLGTRIRCRRGLLPKPHGDHGRDPMIVRVAGDQLTVDAQPLSLGQSRVTIQKKMSTLRCRWSHSNAIATCARVAQYWSTGVTKGWRWPSSVFHICRSIRRRPGSRGAVAFAEGGASSSCCRLSRPATNSLQRL
mmetsp:Transcript_30298/g.85612  ORF Transcript_30298/g.85612 Transcript_30298/m.85612 type:complete len:243 (-) Transcript_30298:2295-3023(-)